MARPEQAVNTRRRVGRDGTLGNPTRYPAPHGSGDVGDREMQAGRLRAAPGAQIEAVAVPGAGEATVGRRRCIERPAQMGPPAEPMRGLVDDLEIATIPGCGHWTPQEQPEALNRILVDWLRRRFGAGAPAD